MVHNITVGRRKTAVARAFLTPGTGNITVNGKDVTKYFTTDTLLEEVRLPMTVTVYHLPGTNGALCESVRVSVAEKGGSPDDGWRLTSISRAGLETVTVTERVKFDTACTPTA